MSSNRDFAVEQIFRADGFRADDYARLKLQKLLLQNVKLNECVNVILIESV